MADQSTAFLQQPQFLDPEQQQQLAEMQRKQKIAELLTARGFESPQGQMVGNRYVAPAWSQYANQLFSAYSGRKAAEDVQSEQVKLAQALKQQKDTETAAITEAMNKGDYKKALTLATQSKTGVGKEFIPALTANIVPKAPTPLSAKDVMQGKYEGWYNPSLAGTPSGVGGSAPTGMPSGVPTGGASGVPLGMPSGVVAPAGMSGRDLSEANKQIFVDKSKRQAEYAEKAPAAIEMMGQTINNINDLIGDTKVVNGKLVFGKKAPHAGFESAVGISVAPLSGFIPGTDTTDFKERFKQIGGQAFLQAFETLKGAGQITEIEGAKATAALNRMSLAQSEVEFVKAAREFEDSLNKGMELARKRAGLPSQQGTWRIK